MKPIIFKNKNEILDFANNMQYLGVNLHNLHNKISDTLSKYNIITSVNDGIEQNDMPFIQYSFTEKKLSIKKHTVRLVYNGKDFCMYCGTTGDDFCNFISEENLYNIDGYGVCKHIMTALYDNKDNIGYMIDDLKSIYNDKFKDSNKNIEPEEPFKQLKRFAFKIPVLVEGDRGSGKTHEAFAYAKSIGIEPSFVGGHAGIESIDLLGCLVHYAGQQQEIEDTSVSAADFFSGNYQLQVSSNNSNGLIWKDGPIAEAFRKAQGGEKSILIIDELLRIPQRELNILLTALSPVDGKYHIRTGRILEVINGVAKEETLSCDTNKLFVLATTNVGGQYAVETIDPALAERFMVVRKDTEYDKLVSILKEKCKEKNFDETFAEKAGVFFNRMISAKEQGLIEECPTLRTLSRAFDLADKEDEINDYIFDQHLLWVTRDVYGKPDKEQVKVVKQILEDIIEDIRY